MNQFKFNSIGIIHSCYKEKFGIPRQPALVDCPASIEINEAYSVEDAFRELETFSHIWVVFVFHAIENKNWKATVRPPRLGGNQRLGVFASRSMFRPNPVGLSVVELKSIEKKANKMILNISGGDFLDKTPVLDIKPYIPYADSITSATGGYAAQVPEKKLTVIFMADAEKVISENEIKYPQLKEIIIAMLQLDPRPAYKKKNEDRNDFAIKLYDFDVKWSVENNQVIVTQLDLL